MHVDKIKKENKNDDMKNGNHNYDSDDSYNSNSDGSEDSDGSGEESGEDEDGLIALKRKQSVLFNVDDLSAMMRRGTVAMNEYTSNRIQRLYREQNVAKYPIFKMCINVTMERMQCMMVVAGATAASLSLLNKNNTVSLTSKDLTVRVITKMKSILMMSGKSNFLKQLKYFRPKKVKRWSVDVPVVKEV